MLLEMVSGVDRGMGVADKGWLKGMGSFGGDLGASHCNQWGLCCIVVQ